VKLHQVTPIVPLRSQNRWSRGPFRAPALRSH
jgi:hypothetical protein